MTWHPLTQPPSEVGPYEINDVFGHTHQVRWDGRHFRYASNGGVVVHYRGDLWRAIETKETEMLSGIDIEDMRPDEPEKAACEKCEGKGWIFRGFGEDSECEVCCDKEPK